MSSIRKATQADFTAIRRIAHETWPLAYGDILHENQIRYMLELFYSDDALLRAWEKGERFLICSGSRPAGFASYCHGFNRGKSTKLCKLYVLPGMQGNGIGYKLLMHVETEALKAGSESVVLNVNRNNKAVDFYKAVGFEIIATEDIDIGHGYMMEDYIMKRTCGPQP